jgi:hypothetical protein
MPIEGDLIPLAQIMPIQLSATSDHEYYGGSARACPPTSPTAI